MKWIEIWNILIIHRFNKKFVGSWNGWTTDDWIRMIFHSIISKETKMKWPEWRGSRLEAGIRVTSWADVWPMVPDTVSIDRKRPTANKWWRNRRREIGNRTNWCRTRTGSWRWRTGSERKWPCNWRCRTRWLKRNGPAGSIPERSRCSALSTWTATPPTPPNRSRRYRREPLSMLRNHWPRLRTFLLIDSLKNQLNWNEWIKILTDTVADFLQFLDELLFLVGRHPGEDGALHRALGYQFRIIIQNGRPRFARHGQMTANGSTIDRFLFEKFIQ